MEKENDLSKMLELVTHPAFLAKDGIICQVNAPAAGMLFEAGMSLDSLLQTGKEEFNALTDGWLCLKLLHNGISCTASVTKFKGFFLFMLDEEDRAELRSFALAGQELRTPLTGMMSAIHRLSELAQSSGEQELMDQSDSVSRSLFQMMRIINNMTDAYRYSTDPVIRLESMDICSFLREKISCCSDLLRFRGTELSFICPEQPIYCHADAEKLERALYNILLNAEKFSPAGSPIQAKLTQKGKMLYLTVQNEGTGSLEALKEDAFSRYRRAPGMEDSRFGIGLGMVLIRAAAAAQGGTVLLEQSPKFGTRVTMSMAISRSSGSLVRSPSIRVDYAGEWNHALLELSEVLPKHLYRKETND